MAYVYRHIRLDKNEPFYIGIGSDEKYRRAYQKINRNKHWRNVVSKTDYEVEILMDGLTWEQACEKEKEFISLYGRKDLNIGTLVNLTDGGDGVLGTKSIKHTDEWKRNMSVFMKGNSYGKGYKQTQEAKSKISEYRKNKNHTIETKLKMSMAHIGNKYAEGYKHTEETKERIGKASSERMKEYWRNKKGGV